jgi:hypothetical protein
MALFLNTSRYLMAFNLLAMPAMNATKTEQSKLHLAKEDNTPGMLTVHQLQGKTLHSLSVDSSQFTRLDVTSKPPTRILLPEPGKKLF